MYVWIKLRDKKDSARLLFVGLVVMLTTGTMDSIRLAYNAWHYDWEILLLATAFVPYDYSLNHLDLFSSLQFPGKSCKSLYFIYLIE